MPCSTPISSVCRWRFGVDLMSVPKHTHTKDCPDHAAATANRKTHEAERKLREAEQQRLARDVWFDWLPSRRAR
jgi:MoxR-like ATPase